MSSVSSLGFARVQTLPRRAWSLARRAVPRRVDPLVGAGRGAHLPHQHLLPACTGKLALVALRLAEAQLLPDPSAVLLDGRGGGEPVLCMRRRQGRWSED